MKSFLPIVCLATSLALSSSILNGQNTNERHWHSYPPVAHSTPSVDYKQGSASKVELRGTSLMPDLKGEAEVKTRTGRAEIEAKLENLNPANNIDLNYLTYVLWAISPDGHPANIGELVVKDHKAEIKTATPMQAFALIVTAEPYYAVSQPGDVVVAENVVNKDTKGSVKSVDVNFELIPRAAYAEQAEPLQKPVYGIDKDTPLSLLEARNAVRIAKTANADEFAASAFQNAQQSLSQAEDYYQRKQSTKSIDTVARAAVQSAETARVQALKAEEQARSENERNEQTRRAEEARTQSEKAKADAQQAQQQAMIAQQQSQLEAQQRQTAEAQQQAAAQQAAKSQADAERAQQQAQLEAQQRQAAEAQQQAAAQQAAQSQADAERARQQAEVEAQQRANAEQQRQQAQAQAQQAQAQAQQAQQQTAQTRAQLLAQLNQVLETRDTARGLIVSMPDVLFDTGKADLKPGTRERLARVAGILIAYPDLQVEINGYTDNTGTAAFNQQLSEERAAAVREYLAQQRVPASSISTHGFGEDSPVASNDNAAGRQQNRRVELVVSGQSIGAQLQP
jgi:outer membrane protein OmpA-like peptidoglycan-associated protein